MTPRTAGPAMPADVPIRTSTGLAVGAVAISLNSAALALADVIHLPTALGGLLKPLVTAIGVSSRPNPWLQSLFHITVGMGMTWTYARALEPRLSGHAVTKGLICAATAWLLNVPASCRPWRARALPVFVGWIWQACCGSPPSTPCSSWCSPCSAHAESKPEPRAGNRPTDPAQVAPPMDSHCLARTKKALFMRRVLSVIPAPACKPGPFRHQT